MLDFFKSDVGKVALGGLIAVSGQLEARIEKLSIFYMPRHSFKDELAGIGDDKKARRAENDRLVASVSPETFQSG